MAGASSTLPTSSSPQQQHLLHSDLNTQLADLVRVELRTAFRDCTERGLHHSAKWAAEQLVGLGPGSCSALEPTPPHPDMDLLFLAKAYFDVKEFDRVAHLLKDCTSPQAVFLGGYAKYLAGERRKEEDMLDFLGPLEQGTAVNNELAGLQASLAPLDEAGALDGFGLYLYGLVLKELDSRTPALRAMVRAVNRYPLLWAAWYEIANLCSEFEVVRTLDLPDHWMKDFFVAHLHLESQHNVDSLNVYEQLSAVFPASTYITAQTAVAKYNLREFDAAEDLFQELMRVDPYRLEAMDTYSNILYVKELSPSLSYLAHHASFTDKYKPETCCIVGNYYSLKADHEKAVEYFRRALKLNRRYLSAWTLMGHEFVEMKNIPAAVEAYRRAVDISPRDYRAWYGLGQTYEILQMPFYALYYYRKATALRPYDARMWCAVANCYEHLGRIVEAIKCYQRAESNNDSDGNALSKLASLCVKQGDFASAEKYYAKNVARHDEAGDVGHDLVEALLFLADYYRRIGKLDEAEKHCTRLLDYGGPEKEEAKAILRDIRSVGVRGNLSASSPSPHTSK